MYSNFLGEYIGENTVRIPIKILPPNPIRQLTLVDTSKFSKKMKDYLIRQFPSEGFTKFYMKVDGRPRSGNKELLSLLKLKSAA